MNAPTQWLATFGPGDLSEWSDTIFRTAPDGPAVVLSFGIVEYGEALVGMLRQAAIDRLQRVGRVARVVPAMTAQEFDAPAAVDALDGCGCIYLQGGNPRLIAGVLHGSCFWGEVTSRKLPVITTSGSAMAMGDRCPDLMAPGWVDGLGVMAGALVAAHWDTLPERWPAVPAEYEEQAEGRPLIALEEESAVVFDGSALTAHGERRVHVLEDGRWRTFGAGDRLDG